MSFRGFNRSDFSTPINRYKPVTPIVEEPPTFLEKIWNDLRVWDDRYVWSE